MEESCRFLLESLGYSFVLLKCIVENIFHLSANRSHISEGAKTSHVSLYTIFGRGYLPTLLHIRFYETQCWTNSIIFGQGSGYTIWDEFFAAGAHPIQKCLPMFRTVSVCSACVCLLCMSVL